MKKSTKSAPKNVSSTVKDAEYACVQGMYGNIKRSLDWQFSLGEFSPDAAKQKLERDVLVAQAYAAISGESQTLAQAVALMIAGSYAPPAPQHADQAKRMVRRMRVRAIRQTQDKIAELQAVLAKMTAQAETEIAEIEDGAATDEEYDNFRTGRE